jgi:tetratricopeptide (TPR) repeat protein
VILAKGEGNPFFLEELARAAVERGADAATIVLPDTVQAVLLARIDRLPATIKQLVQTAAVIGREVPARLLGETWRGPALEPLLAELKRLEFLYEQPGAGAPLLVFKHALTQQAAYESLLTPRRETLHGEIGHALEGLYSDRLEEAYALLAHHYALSANADKALEYLELANRKAMATSAMTEAHMAFVAAMNLLDAAPDTPLNRTRRLRLVTSNVTVFQMLAQLDQYMGYLKNHEQLAVELGDAALLGRLYGSQAQVEFLFGHYDRAIQLCMKAAGLCAEASHWEGAGHAYMLLEWSYLFLGQYDDVLRAREDALLALERGFNPRWYMWTLSGAALAYAWMGRWQDAESEGRKALGAAESASDESLVSFASWVLGICRLKKGDVARAVDLMDQGVSRAPTPIDKIWAQGFRGWAMCRLGKGNGEIRAVEQGVQLMQQAGFGGPSQWFMHCLGEAYVWLGEYDKARGVLRELLGLADNSARYAIGPCHRLLGEIAMQLDPGPSGLEEATRHFEEAIPLLAAANGMENELALTYVAFGRVCARQGKMAAAREYLERAAEIFERLGTLNEPDRVRAALAELPPA